MVRTLRWSGPFLALALVLPVAPAADKDKDKMPADKKAAAAKMIAAGEITDLPLGRHAGSVSRERRWHSRTNHRPDVYALVRVNSPRSSVHLWSPARASAPTVRCRRCGGGRATAPSRTEPARSLR